MIRRLLPLFALLPALASAAPAATPAPAANLRAPSAKTPLWIEAENAPRHNFPPSAENPFRAQAFWETDILSGGEWVGTLWKTDEPAPFLEFDIEVPEAGKYSLYLRKFGHVGNIQWRINEGTWHKSPQERLSFQMDSVSMRGSAERISVGWTYLGAEELPAGPHTLRIEATQPGEKDRILMSGGMVLAIDAIFLTKDLFFPSGKLKPGDKHPMRDGLAFAFQPGVDPFAPGALDLRTLNEPFAGAKGGIVNREGRLVFRDSGEPARMVGINYNGSKYMPPEAFDYLARSLAKRGINFVRLDISQSVQFSRQSDGSLVTEFLESPLAQIAQLFEALKSQGIYTALTWNVIDSEGFREIYDPTLQISTPEKTVYDNKLRTDLAAIIMFDPMVREAYWKVWKAVLGLKLSDGTKLGADPALFLVTIAQQASLLEEISLPFENLPPAVRTELQSAWKKWVAAKYGSPQKAAKAWAAGKDVRNPDEVPEIRKILASRDAWSRDGLRFWAGLQANFFAGAVRQFREAGYKGLLSATNKSNTNPEILGFADIASRSAGDVIERNGSLRGDFVPKYDIWNFTEGALFKDRSPVALDTLTGLEAARFELPFKSPAYAGNPSALTEIGIALPNKFSGEFPLVTFTLSALQDVAILGFSSMSVENWQASMSSMRSQIFTPAMLGQMPALAFAFRKGLLPGPVTAARLDLGDEAAFSLKPAAFFEAPNTQLSADQRLPEGNDGEIDPAIWLTGAVAVKTDAKTDAKDGHFELVKPGKILPDGSIEAADAQVRWNPQRRLLVVDAPAFQAVTGALREAGPIRLGALEIRSPMETGTICAVALDSKPLDFSRKILVQVFSEESNVGFLAQQAGELSAIRSVGRPPLLVKALTGEITFLRPDADDLVATALDTHGNALLPAGLGATLRLLPSTMYYLIEK